MTQLPKPLIIDQHQVHLTKKACIEAGLPLKASVVPKSPTKKCHTLSNNSNRAISISFIESSEHHLSLVYDPTLNKTYFEQCFYDIQLIGEGSFGVVFSVRFKEDNKMYAIKKSKEPFNGNNDKRIKLEEVRKHEMIPKHPNCVQIYGSWIEDNCLYIQLELCDTSLEHYASINHDISEEMLWNILTDMLLAVKNLHDNNLIHLDIKLENILMSSNGTYKLADFGLVSDVNKIKADTLEGDQRYLAPELLSGHFTKAADIFSLGIVMLELACDLLLPSNGVLWQQLRNDVFPDTYIENIPHELMETIKKMMSSNYLNRPTVDDLLQIERIQNLLAERKVSKASRCQGLFVVLEEDEDDCQILEGTPDHKNTSALKPAKITSSTPKPNFPEPITTQWKMNVEISPIQQTDIVEPHISWDGRWVTTRRPYKDDCKKNLNRSNYLTQTPRSSTKKSRIANNTGVGRRLF